MPTMESIQRLHSRQRKRPIRSQLTGSFIASDSDYDATRVLLPAQTQREREYCDGRVVINSDLSRRQHQQHPKITLAHSFPWALSPAQWGCVLLAFSSLGSFANFGANGESTSGRKPRKVVTAFFISF